MYFVPPPGTTISVGQNPGDRQQLHQQQRFTPNYTFNAQTMTPPSQSNGNFNFFFFSFLSLSFPFLFFSVWTKRPIVSFSKLYEQLSSTLQLGPCCRSDTGRLYLSTTSTYGSNVLPTTRTTAYAATTSYVQSTYTTEYSDIESGKKESIYIFPPILPTIIFTIKFYNIYNVNLNFSMIPLS